MSAGTVFSVLTPSGRGAVTVIGVSGPSAVMSVGQFFIAQNRKSLERQAIARIVYGTWRFDGEDLVVCRRDTECVEVHCHGGSQAVSTIAGDLTRAGCEEIPWQQWLARDESCPLRVEAQTALAEAVSTRAALILLDQYHGALRKELEEIIALLGESKLRSRPEPKALATGDPDSTFDTSSPDASAYGSVSPGASRPTPRVGARGSVACERLEALLATAEVGLHLTQPWQVVIAGRPNVGKSSLINAMVGYRRAIVFDQPGTTRDVVTASTVIDGWPVSLSDTAGLHEANDELETAGIELAKERLAQADLVVWVLDATEVLDDLGEIVRQQINELSLAVPAKRLVVLNKIDRAPGAVASEGVIVTSAVAGTGIDELLAAISATLVPEVPETGAAVVFTERQRAAVEAALQSCRDGAGNSLTQLESLLQTGFCGE